MNRGPGYCRDCQIAAKQKKEQPLCVFCSNRYPEIKPANCSVLEVIDLCKNQWIYAGDFPLGLSWQTIIEVADRIGIDVNQDFLQRLKIYESAALEEMLKALNK